MLPDNPMIKSFTLLSTSISLLFAASLGGCHQAAVTGAASNEAIIYRLVEPLFNAAQDSRVMMIKTGASQPELLLEKKGHCIGCHAYSSTGLVALNVKKSKDRRFVVIKFEEKGISLFDAKKIGEFSFLAWSPDSRYLAMAVNTFGVIDIKNDVREPFNLRYQSGDIAIYDPATKEIKLLPGASEMDFVEDMPAWSPDGKELLFVKYRSEKDAPIDNMSIYHVPFNNGEGGAPEPVVSAKGSGDFNYFPAYSPDGRWISFVKGDGSQGVFARPSSDIYILPREGGAAKKLSLNTDGVMDSWHRWAEDGKGLLFASKRGGDMTSLFLGSVDARGESAQPVRIISHRDAKINIPGSTVYEYYSAIAPNMFNDMLEKIYAEGD